MAVDLLPVADAIESLCCVEIRPPDISYGVVRPLAAMAREKQGAPPILLAARRLVERVGRGTVVAIATGFLEPTEMPRGETDGPPGVASLALALARGLGAVPLVLAEEPCLEPTRAALEAVGLAERPLEEAMDQPASFVLRAFPCDATAGAAAAELIRRTAPSAVLVIEKPGLNARGVAHRGGGRALPESDRMRVEALTERARRAGILTVAIGDSGNEAGMGLVAEAVRAHHPYGSLCRCPCRGGIAAAEECDVTVVASISNWGAYGVAAMMAVLLGDEGLLHDAETERRMIEECVAVGAVDGFHNDRRIAVDGVPARLHGHLVDLLHGIVGTALGRGREL